uniref:DUF5753 domain-containing protein n=1 Tax=Ascaris lumbricoides TaxID=6252 RepID=A0A0M3HQX1_ASCLU
MVATSSSVARYALPAFPVMLDLEASGREHLSPEAGRLMEELLAGYPAASASLDRVVKSRRFHRPDPTFV